MSATDASHLSEATVTDPGDGPIDVATLRARLARAFLVARVPGVTEALVTDPEAAVDLVMRFAVPAIEAARLEGSQAAKPTREQVRRALTVNGAEMWDETLLDTYTARIMKLLDGAQ